MAMLTAVARISGRLGLRVEVASLNHGLRPEAAAEVELVRGLAARHGLAFHTRCLEVAKGAGVEAAARSARYAALEELRAARELDFVATAHTASDQAETLLMRLSRGAALGGASGIRARREDRVIRPLLFATRADVEAYVAALKLPTASDAMNRDPAYLRVRVRREVLPALEAAAGPGAAQALARFAAYAAEDDAWLNGQADRAWDRLAHADGTLDAAGVRALDRPLRRRIVARFLVGAGLPVDGALVEDVIAALDQRRLATLPRDRVLDGGAAALEVVPAPPRRLHRTSPSPRRRGGG